MGTISRWIVTSVTDSHTKVVAVVGSTGLTNNVTCRAIGMNGTIGGDAIAQPDECSSNVSNERRGSTKLGSDGLSFKECNTHCVQKLAVFTDSDIQLNFTLWTKDINLNYNVVSDKVLGFQPTFSILIQRTQ